MSRGDLIMRYVGANRRYVMETSNDQKLKELLREAYADTHEKMKVPAMGEVVKDGLIISYGPPISRPDMLLISFQGELILIGTYMISGPRDYTTSIAMRFGAALRNRCRDTGLYHSLKHSAMALPVESSRRPGTKKRVSGKERPGLALIGGREFQ